jgi:putative membrane protein
MRFYLMLFFVVILIAIAFIFGTQNNQIISLNYLIARAELSVAQAVSLFTLLGFILGVFMTLLWRVKRTMTKRKVKKNKIAQQIQSPSTSATGHPTNHKVSS